MPTCTASRIHRNDSTKAHVCSRGNTFAYSSTNPNRQTHRQTGCNPCAAANRPAGWSAPSSRGRRESARRVRSRGMARRYSLSNRFTWHRFRWTRKWQSVNVRGR